MAGALQVLHVSMECVPISKVGGMADVVGSLPAALRDHGIDSRVLTPYYPQLHKGPVGDEITTLSVRVGDIDHSVRLLEAGDHAVLVDSPTAYDRRGVYDDPLTSEGFGDSLFRCLVLQQAARIAVREKILPADLVHCHDNHTGLVPVYLKDDGGPPSVFTIHNLAYQGIYGSEEFWITGLAPDRFYGYSAFEYHGDLSLLKAGITHADLVTTVSPSYAAEIVQPEHGHGLDGVLRDLGPRLVGILNGIDTETWSPQTDSLIPAKYSVRSMKGKEACKRALLHDAGLDPAMEAPLCGMVSRVTHQKGLDLVGHLLPWLVHRGARVVLLGSGDPSILDLFRGAAGSYPGRVAVVEGYDEELSHRIYAGSDIFFVPSRFEPCGLTQMYAMRYGAVPVATAMGGLKDTVLPFDDDRPGGTGVLSHWATEDSLRGAIEYALDLYGKPRKFRRMRRNGMEREFSWAGSAREYARRYEQLLG